MLALKSKIDKKRILITNYKVMFASLNHQENLELIHPLKFFLSGLFPDSNKLYLIVRNPYARLESFFKNKFRTAARKNKVEHCHTIFFKYLNINDLTPRSEIGEKLLSTSFNDFISLLEKVYLKDQHLHPQSFALKYNFSRKDFIIKHKRIEFEKIFKLECKDNISKIESIFDIDLSRKRNYTKNVKENIEWGDESQKIIRNIYKQDFLKFNYSTDPSYKNDCIK